jgi:hypothetical protein
MVAMDGFDCLLKPDGDQQPHADGGDVDEEGRAPSRSATFRGENVAWQDRINN